MEVFNKMILMNYFATLNPVAFTNALPGNIAQGLIWGIMALGVYITFRLLDFADLTVDGSFATGGAVTVMMTINGYNIWVSLLCACIAGLLAGLCTGLLHTKLGIPPILAGILTQIALYSINLNIMQRHANQALSADKYNLVLSSRNLTHAIIVGVIFSVVIIAVLYWYFGTEQGSAIRATGCNPAMSKAQGINIDNMKLIGLALSLGASWSSMAFSTASTVVIPVAAISAPFDRACWIMAMASAAPSTGSVPAPSSSNKIRLSSSACRRISTVLDMWAEKVDRLCSMDCSSPTSARIRSNTRTVEPLSAGMCKPH